jgi:hypothetical protein
MNRALAPVLLVAFVVVGAGLAGCATGALSTAARDNLAASASCPADQVKVEELGDSKYRASGCQKTETYVCKAAEHAVVSCVPESSVRPLPDTPPAK